MHSYDWRIWAPFANPLEATVAADGGLAEDADLPVVLVDASGRRHAFAYEGAQAGLAVFAPTGVTALPGARLQVDLASGAWSLLLGDNRVWRFDNQGHLHHVQAIDGQSLAIERPVDEPAREVAVSDSWGRRVLLDRGRFGTGSAESGFASLSVPGGFRQLRPWVFPDRDEHGRPEIVELAMAGPPRRYALAYHPDTGRLESITYPRPGAIDGWDDPGRDLIIDLRYDQPDTARFAGTVHFDGLFGGEVFTIDPVLDVLRSHRNAHGDITTWRPSRGIQRVRTLVRGRYRERSAYDGYGRRTSLRIGRRTDRWTYKELADVPGSWLLVDQHVAGVTATFTYHEHGPFDPRTGRLATRQVGPLAAESFTVHERGQVAHHRDARGKTWRFEDFDRFGRWRLQTSPAGRVARRFYLAGPDGHLAWEEGFDRVRVTTAFDHRHRPVWRQVENRPAATTRYDLFDRVLESTDANGDSATRAYNRLDQLRSSGSSAGGYDHHRYSWRPPDLVVATTRRADANPPLDASDAQVVERLRAGDRLVERVERVDLGQQLGTGSATRAFHHSPEGWVVGIEGPRAGQLVTIKHRSDGLVTSRSQPGSQGALTVYHYTPEGRLRQTIDPDGVWQRRGYDALGRLATSEQQGVGETVFTYDGPVLHQVQAPGMAPVTYAYDDDGLRTETTGPDGHRQTRSVAVSDQGLVVTTGLSFAGEEWTTSSATFAANGLLEERQQRRPGDVAVISNFSDHTGSGTPRRVKSRRGAYNAVRAWTPSPLSAAIPGSSQVTNAEGEEVTSATVNYNRTWGTVASSEALGLGRSFDVDQATGAIRAAGDDVTGDTRDTHRVLERDVAGNVLLYLDADGRRHEQGFDLDNRLAWTVGPDFIQTEYTYTPGGRLVETTTSPLQAVANLPVGGGSPGSQAAPQRTVYDYDQAGRLRRVVGPDEVETRSTYDQSGRLRRSVRAGLCTTYTYGPNNRVRIVRGPDSTTRYTYDSAGQVTQVSIDGRSGGASSTSAYDRGRLVATETALGRSQVVYGPEGLPVETVQTLRNPDEPGLGTWTRTVTLERGQNGLVTGRTVAVETDETHDEVVIRSHLDQFDRSLGTDGGLRWRLDARGRRVATWLDGEGQELATSWTAEQHGNLVAASGNQRFVRNPTSSLVEAATAVVGDEVVGSATYQRDAWNRVVVAELPDGRSRHYSYDNAGRVVGLGEHRDGEELAHFAVDYEQETGRIARIRERSQAGPTRNHTFRYHQRTGRLVHERRGDTLVLPGDFDLTYRYDQFGRRSRVTGFHVPAQFGWTFAFTHGDRAEEARRALHLFPAPEWANAAPTSEPEAWFLDPETGTLAVRPQRPGHQADILKLELVEPSQPLRPVGGVSFQLDLAETLPLAEANGASWTQEFRVKLLQRIVGPDPDDKPLRAAIISRTQLISAEDPGAQPVRQIAMSLEVTSGATVATSPWTTVWQDDGVEATGSATVAISIEHRAGRFEARALHGADTVPVVVGIPAIQAKTYINLVRLGDARGRFDLLHVHGQDEGPVPVRLRARYSDHADRLTRFEDQESGDHQEFSYNPFGGMRERRWYHADEEEPYRVQSLSYDALDRLETVREDWDLPGPAAGDTPAAVTWTYRYVGHTPYVKTLLKDGKPATTFSYRGTELIRVEIHGDDGAVSETVDHHRLPHGAWEKVVGGDRRYRVTDTQGHARGLVATGGLASWEIFDAYGVTRHFATRADPDGSWSSAEPDPNPGYRRHWQFRETGLVKMGHRYYAPELGLFTQVDPARAGTNWYAYAGGDPVNRWDPSGLDDIEFVPLETGPNGESLSLVFWRSMIDGSKRESDVLIPIGIMQDQALQVPAQFRTFHVPEAELVTPGSVSRLVPMTVQTAPERIEIQKADSVELLLPLIDPAAGNGSIHLGLSYLKNAAQAVNTRSGDLGIVDTTQVMRSIAGAIAEPMINPPKAPVYMMPGSPLITRKVTIWSDYAWGPVSKEFTATEAEWGQIDSMMPFIDQKGSTIRVAGEMGMAAWAANDIYMLGRAGYSLLARQGLRQAARTGGRESLNLRPLGFDPNPALVPEVVLSRPAASSAGAKSLDDIIALVRRDCGGDCEAASMLLQDYLGSAAINGRFAGGGSLHEYVILGREVLDVTAAQFVRQGGLNLAKLNQLGMTEAMVTGRFTAQQHSVLLKMIEEIASKAQAGVRP